MNLGVSRAASNASKKCTDDIGELRNYAKCPACQAMHLHL